MSPELYLKPAESLYPSLPPQCTGENRLEADWSWQQLMPSSPTTLGSQLNIHNLNSQNIDTRQQAVVEEAMQI